MGYACNRSDVINKERNMRDSPDSMMINYSVFYVSSTQVSDTHITKIDSNHIY